MGLEELESALAQAVAETETHARRPTVEPAPRPRTRSGGVVRLDDEDLRLPPIRRAARPAATVAEALSQSGASAFVPAWYVVRETLAVGSLFWLAVIVLAFALQVDDLAAPLAAAVVARGLWLVVSPRR